MEYRSGDNLAWKSRMKIYFKTAFNRVQLRVEYIEVGFSSKSFGINGALKCVFHEHYLDDVLKAKALFFHINGQYIPFFPEKISFDNFYRLKLEGVNTKEETLLFHNKSIYLRVKEVRMVKEMEDIQQFIGYRIFDITSNQDLGLIIKIHELPEQLLAEIHWKNKAVYIPLHPILIAEENRAIKCLKMKLPEGLLDL